MGNNTKWLEDLRKTTKKDNSKIKNCETQADHLGLKNKNFLSFVNLCTDFGLDNAIKILSFDGEIAKNFELINNTCENGVDPLNITNDEKTIIIRNCIAHLVSKITNNIWIRTYDSRKETALHHSAIDCNISPKIDEKLTDSENICLAKKSDEYKKLVLFNEVFDFLFPSFVDKANAISLDPRKYKRHNVNEDYVLKNPALYNKLKLLEAYLVSDGSMDIDLTKSRYMISFINMSDVLLENFMNLVKDIDPLTKFYITKGHRGSINVRIQSRPICELISKISPSARTKAFTTDEERDYYLKHKIFPPIKEEKGINKYNLPVGYFYLRYKDKSGTYKKSSIPISIQFPPTNLPEVDTETLKRGILRIFADTEGSVQCNIHFKSKVLDPESGNPLILRRTLSIANLHPTVLEQLSEMLKDLGIDSKIITNDRVTISLKDIKKFQEKVNFTKGVKILKSPYFRGFDKKSVLNLSTILNLLSTHRKLFFKYLGKSENDLHNLFERGFKIYEKKYLEQLKKHNNKDLSVKIAYNSLTDFLNNNNILFSSKLEKTFNTEFIQYLNSKSQVNKENIVDILKVGSINNILSQAVYFYEDRLETLRSKNIKDVDEIANKDLAKYLCNSQKIDLLPDERGKIINDCNFFINQQKMLPPKQLIFNLLQPSSEGLSALEIRNKSNLSSGIVKRGLRGLVEDKLISYKLVSESGGRTIRKYFIKKEGIEFPVHEPVEFTTRYKIIKLLESQPGLLMKDIAKKINRSESHVSSQLRKLNSDDVIYYELVSGLGKDVKIYYLKEKTEG